MSTSLCRKMERLMVDDENDYGQAKKKMERLMVDDENDYGQAKKKVHMAFEDMLRLLIGDINDYLPEKKKVHMWMPTTATSLCRKMERLMIDDKNDYGQAKKKVHTGMPTTEWLSVYNLRPSMKQRYHYNIRDVRLARYIKKGNKDGLFISSVASCSNLWTIIMDKGTGFTAQIFKVSPLFLHKEWILKHWKGYYSISAIAGANNGSSLVVMSKGTRYQLQSYKVSKSFPIEWINKKHREGFHVTAMATSGIKWAIVMSLVAGFSDQVVELDPLPITIQRRLDDGYHITSTAATSDQTAIVLSIPVVKDPYETQETLQTSAFPSRRIKENWTRNLYVTSVCYGRSVS